MAWRDDAAFNRTMDAIYASFMARKAAVEGRHDREVRDPSIVLDLARRLDLMPDPARVVRVTGSKGKGTTARMIARLLQAAGAGPVGLFVSPEEWDHNDRMRLDGEPATKAEFVATHARLAPALAEIEAALPPGRYVSPFGTFLLIALAWFRATGAHWLVLEGGRGARYDEVGNLPSAVAVLTSIMLEHPAHLGPTLADIAENKLWIGVQSDVLVAAPDPAAWNERLGAVAPDKIRVAEPQAPDPDLPAWFAGNRALAEAAAHALLGRPAPPDVPLADASAAFGRTEWDGLACFWDACIGPASLDRPFLDRLAARHPRIAVVASLPDDKDAGGLRAAFAGLTGRPPVEIALTGTRGYLHYDRARAEGRVRADLHFEDEAGLRHLAQNIAAEAGADTLYFAGTQTFVRLVRHALARQPAPPG